jgi:Uma2 family endonuclease
MSVVIDGITKLTYSDYAQLPDDGRRHEIIDGEHYVSPSPSSAHQDASRHIQFQLYEHIEVEGLGKVYNAPMDLQLSDTDVVQPDLMVILREHEHYISPSRIIGTPDLIVEIKSPTTAEHDRGVKRSLYQQYGVPEYWIVDVDSHTVERYVLEGDRYRLDSTCREQITYTAEPVQSRPERVSAPVDLRKVW